MMPAGHLGDIINTDIYIIDQILKGRYSLGGKLLDAGCGGGRNLSWFVTQPAFDLYATDIDQHTVSQLLQTYPSMDKDHVICCPLQALPFADAFFDHIICSTVLHFAASTADFWQMFSELIRVLKPAGSLFIRMASDIGIEGKIVPLGNGRFALPDDTDRYLLTRDLIDEVSSRFPIRLIEPVKTTNVQDTRSMTTLVMVKSI